VNDSTGKRGGGVGGGGNAISLPRADPAKTEELNVRVCASKGERKGLFGNRENTRAEMGDQGSGHEPKKGARGGKGKKKKTTAAGGLKKIEET